MADTGSNALALNGAGSTDPLPEVPGYRTIRAIGEGGMGRVYLAVQESLDRSVVIKVLNSVDDGSMDKLVERFEREAVLMAKGSHPNVVGIIDRGTVDGHLYIVMEYVEGGDLRSRLQEAHQMPLGEVRPILLSISRALMALHDKGIIHRDLKPENVLFDEAGTARITDFGIAASLNDVGELTSENASPGTLDYMAPEQRYRLRVDARTDQYALAIIAYEMLSGRRPRGIFRPPSDYNPHLSKTVDDVILRGLREDPDERFPTVGDFSEALDQSLAKCSTVQGAAVGTLKRFWRSVSKLAGISTTRDSGQLSRRIMAALIVVLGAIAVIGLLRPFSSEDSPDSPKETADASESSTNRLVETEGGSENATDPSVGTDDGSAYSTSPLVETDDGSGDSTVGSVGTGDRSENSTDPSVGMIEAANKPEVVEQAGALAYRTQGGVVQIMLVRSRKDEHWSIPKGTKDDGVMLSETAVEEAFEEGGIRGALGSTEVGSYFYSKKGKLYRVVVFPILVREELSKWPEDFRRREWFTIEAAAEQDAPDGLRDLIRSVNPNDL